MVVCQLLLGLILSCGDLVAAHEGLLGVTAVARLLLEEGGGAERERHAVSQI
jgi:hypothetical protein